MDEQPQRPQPRNGDTVLHCGHMDDPRDEGQHVFKFPNLMQFRRPNGTTGTTQWLIVCGSCFTAAVGDPSKIAIKGDAKFKGDELIVWAKPEV